MKVTSIAKPVLYAFYFYLVCKLLWLMRKRNVNHLVELEYIMRQPKMPKAAELAMASAARENISNFYGRFERPIRLPTDFKYILRWTKAISHYTKFVDRTGQKTFIDHKCERINCIMTNDDRLINDYRHFDAIVFDVENYWDYFPAVRASHQLYVFLASEAAVTYPICHPLFEDFYNLTWTYRLDSDIRWSFLTILNKKDEVVGPKETMTWITSDEPPSPQIRKMLSRKRKAVAWFVSNCKAGSGRNEVARALTEQLAKFNHTVDIFGNCGHKKCDRSHMQECLEGMSEVYYFYLAFENSLCDDYVTEKVLHATQHYTVPVVYGGADYDRFLPPGSYLDATKSSPTVLAAEINKAIENKEIYYSYFRWLNHYRYVSEQPNHDVCQLCNILHEQGDATRSVPNFREWWHPAYQSLCEEKMQRLQDRPSIVID